MDALAASLDAVCIVDASVGGHQGAAGVVCPSEIYVRELSGGLV